MATISGGINNYCQMDLIVAETGVSTSGNVSYISWKLVGYLTEANSAYWVSNKTNDVSVVINGTTVLSRVYTDEVLVSIGTNHTASSPCIIAGGTLTIPHNADGTKTISCSFSFQFHWNPSRKWSGSGNVGLTNILRATQPVVSADTVDIGNSVIINMPRAAGNLKHTLVYKFGSATGIIGTDLDTSYEWVLPLELLNQIPSDTAGTLTIFCETLNGSTSIGKKTVSIKAKVPASIIPNISNIAISDATDLYSRFNKYIKTKSKLNINVDASGAYGSTIKAYKINANGVIYTTSSCTTSELATAGTNTITVTVTDTRGRTATSTVTLNVVDYIAPVISIFSAVRCDGNMQPDPDGAKILIDCAVSVTNFSELTDVNKNDVIMIIQYRVQGTSDWTVIRENEQIYSWAMMISADADIDNMYEVQIVVSDSFNTAKKTVLVSTAYTLLDFRENGKGVAFGKVATQDGLDVNMPAMFRNTVEISDKIDVGRYAMIRSGVCVHRCNDGQGTNGYWHVATIKFTGTYNSSPIKFTYNERSREGTVTIMWYGGNTTDPSINLFTQNGSTTNQCGVYLYKSATSTWELYIRKSESYGDLTIINFDFPFYQRSRMTWTWNNATITSLPTGYVKAEVIKPAHTTNINVASGKTATIKTIDGRVLSAMFTAQMYGSGVSIAGCLMQYGSVGGYVLFKNDSASYFTITRSDIATATIKSTMAAQMQLVVMGENLSVTVS